mmetsp:Transcript_2596/g.6346  ORF Transcript_2596/g.6346 Transcript_2596/m.6346 type:complete len:159 (+) Transcript_2596:426-902(+)
MSEQAVGVQARMDAPWNTVLVHAGTEKRDGVHHVMALTCTDAPLEIRFVRGYGSVSEGDLGGRPAARVSKFGRSAGVQGGAGGSRARKVPKKKGTAPWNVTGRGGGKKRKAPKQGEDVDDCAVLERLRRERLTPQEICERAREVEASMHADSSVGHLP